MRLTYGLENGKPYLVSVAPVDPIFTERYPRVRELVIFVVDK